MAYSIDRTSDSVEGFEAINFSDNKLTFGKDLMQCLDEIFTKFNFRKLTYNVLVGNPIEKTYDKLTEKYGGEVVGVQKLHVKLIDGNYCDLKTYEIFKEAYLKNKKTA